MVSVAIFDYGAGNIFSLKNSLLNANAKVDVISDFDGPNKYDGLLLPGVGNFDPAMSTINESKTRFEEYAGDMPVLGICLGMEMFFKDSQEGVQKGLDVIDGTVLMLPSSMKVPHMGWNDLCIKKSGTILQGVDDGAWVYFVHSFMAKPHSDEIITAESNYGVKVPAVIEKDNYIGTQFHPEKSGPVGKIMIQNFLNVCKK